ATHGEDTAERPLENIAVAGHAPMLVKALDRRAIRQADDPGARGDHADIPQSGSLVAVIIEAAVMAPGEDLEVARQPVAFGKALPNLANHLPGWRKWWHQRLPASGFYDRCPALLGNVPEM